MKKIILILALCLMATLAFSQTASVICDNVVQFPTAAAAGAGTHQFYGPYEVLSYWHPFFTIGNATVGTDSAWCMTLSSSVYNTADSGSVHVIVGFSDLKVSPSRGYAGTVNDSLKFPGDSCCSGTQGSVKVWASGVTALSLAANPILCAAADTAAANSVVTSDRTTSVSVSRITTTRPLRYMYVQYNQTAGNSAYNRAYNQIIARKP